MEKDKRGILGLETVKMFIIVLLGLAIVGVITLMILGSITTTQLISQTGLPISGSVANETLTTVTETGENLAYFGYVNAACGSYIVLNATDNVVLTSGNYTSSNGGCTLAFASGGTRGNNSDWKVSYAYSYNDRSRIDSITGNVSTGVSGFFANSTTYFALLGVVVIILIISLVVVVVNRFGGGRESEESGL